MPLAARGEVAMAGTFGYEMDVRTFTEEEKKQVRQQIADYERLAQMIREGDYYRLTNPEEKRELAAWQFSKKDGSEALVSVVSLHAAANPPFQSVRLRGLNPQGIYQIEGKEQLYRGNALMNAGLPIPVMMGDYRSVHYVLKQIVAEPGREESDQEETKKEIEMACLL